VVALEVGLARFDVESESGLVRSLARAGQPPWVRDALAQLERVPGELAAYRAEHEPLTPEQEAELERRRKLSRNHAQAARGGIYVP
jgi:hypothetical protein